MMPGNDSELNRISGGQPAGGRDDWSEPQAQIIPNPTYWPAVLALGVLFMFWGIVTLWVVSLVGFVLLGIALAGWIGELRHEHRNRRTR